jgi:hypothetical protein
MHFVTSLNMCVLSFNAPMLYMFKTHSETLLLLAELRNDAS